MQLPDSLASDAELATNLLQGNRIRTIQSEAGVDDLFFTLVELLQDLHDLHLDILLTEALEGVDRHFVSDEFSKFGRVLLTDGRVERGGTDCRLFELGDLFGIHPNLLGDFLVGRLPAQLVTEPGTDSADLGDLVDQMHGKANCLSLIGQRPFDRLLDPPGPVG